MRTNARLIVCLLGAGLIVCTGALLSGARSADAARVVTAPTPLAGAALPGQTHLLFFPLVNVSELPAPACTSISGVTYNTLSVNPPPTDRPAAQSADLNLGWRGYALTGGNLGLVDYGGPTDPAAPQFPALFADWRTPAFTDNYEVYNWSWSCNCASTLMTNPPVTLTGMGTSPDETIGVPNSDYDIGQGYQVLVLYAAPTRITLKYTRDDNVVAGYAVHVENVCVEPSLLDLYQRWNAAGRGQLPALRAAQPFGRAIGAEISVGIQDSGAWMDPRSRKDWWQGR